MFQMAAMKRAALLLSVVSAACSAEQTGGNSAAPSATSQLECAIGGGAFARICTVEQVRGAEGVTLTIHEPQGGFRRLLVTPAGEVVAADGAERAMTVPLPDGRVEVTIGRDRYRIPPPAAQ